MYTEIAGELPDIFKKMNTDQLRQFLLHMSDVWFEQRNNIHLWYAASEKSTHITNLLMNQKTKCHKTTKLANSLYPSHCDKIYVDQNIDNQIMHMDPASGRNCFFKDNYLYNTKQTKLSTRNNRQSTKYCMTSGQIAGSIETIASSQYSNSFDTGYSDGSSAKSRNGYFYDYQLLGDDHLMALASAELNGKSEYTRMRRGKRMVNVQNVGLCYSGQTIRAAIKRIRSGQHFVDNKIIINLGSVDLLHGRDLIDMQSDFCELVEVLEHRNIVPIITTLAPIANFGFLPEQRIQFDRFNTFLRTKFDNVIDLWSIFVKNSKYQTIYELYKS